MWYLQLLQIQVCPVIAIQWLRYWIEPRSLSITLQNNGASILYFLFFQKGERLLPVWKTVVQLMPKIFCGTIQTFLNCVINNQITTRSLSAPA